MALTPWTLFSVFIKVYQDYKLWRSTVKTPVTYSPDIKLQTHICYVPGEDFKKTSDSPWCLSCHMMHPPCPDASLQCCLHPMTSLRSGEGTIGVLLTSVPWFQIRWAHSVLPPPAKTSMQVCTNPQWVKNQYTFRLKFLKEPLDDNSPLHM